MNTRFFLAVVLLSLAACSPYTSQIKNLDKSYAAGQIPPRDYYALRAQLLDSDSQWRANFAANMQAAAANINRQNEINAYNARTQALSQPQRINVHHSGYINHNVTGTIYHSPYYGY